jgi:hypothetical protein
MQQRRMESEFEAVFYWRLCEYSCTSAGNFGDCSWVFGARPRNRDNSHMLALMEHLLCCDPLLR